MTPTPRASAAAPGTDVQTPVAVAASPAAGAAAGSPAAGAAAGSPAAGAAAGSPAAGAAAGSPAAGAAAVLSAVPAQPVPTQPIPQAAPLQPVPRQPVPAQPILAQPAPAQPAPAQPIPARPLPQAVLIRPAAGPARVRRRHWGLAFAFVLLVLVPVAAAVWYLYDRAADQYASTLGFTVRNEDVSSATDLLGGLGSSFGVTTGGGRDADILYEFIRSQEMTALIDARLDLRGMYTKARAQDPLMSFDPAGTIEDLTAYWRRMVRVSYDASSGLMELRVLAFAPADAEAIATAIQDESSKMINALSAIAREDATRYAREDLDLAIERLKQAREALTAFRVENQIVDLTADIQGQMGLLATLQTQLATALIEFDLLAGTSREGDPRLEQAERRIEVINARIAEERQKFGAGGQTGGGESYATIVAEFERLTVDREFAEQAYIVTLSAYDAARAEANRQSRYLAAYIQPTLAERSEFPQRELLAGVVALFAFLIWAIGGLIYYSLRDSR